MKLYIYEMNFLTERTITEHCCEAIETQRTFTSANGKPFPSIMRIRISKASMPKVYNEYSVVSTKPLTEEQVKTIFIGNREEAITQLVNRIREKERQIERIANAEFVRG